jgi:hypothetical protein
MELQELSNPMTVSVLGRQGVLERAHLVAKLIELLAVSAGRTWRRIA